MRHLLHGGVVAGVVLGIACAPAAVPVSGARPVEKYVAPSRLTIRATTESAHSPRTGYTIYVENESTVPIMVTSVTLRNCENVRGICDGPVPVNVRIKPGQREVIKRVDRRNEGMGMSYRYSYTWRPESGPASTAPVNADEEERAEARADAAAALAMAAAAGPDPLVPIPDIRALVAAGATLRVEPDSIEMRVGETRNIGDFRVALYDSAGTRRGRAPYSIRFPTNRISFAPPTFTAITAGDAVITFTLPAVLLADPTLQPTPAYLVVIIRE